MSKNETLEILFDDHLYQTVIREDRGFAIIHLDIKGNIIRWNYRAESILGFNENEIKGQNFSTIFTPEDLTQHIPEKELDQAQKIGRIEDTRWYRRKDGSRIYANSVTSVIKNESGISSGYTKVVRDDTERKRMEDALKESNDRIGNILESITDAFFTLDKNWCFAYLNKQSERLLQRSREELMGKNIWEEFPDAVGTKFYTQYQKAVSEQVSVTFEEFYPPLNNWFEVRAYPSPEGLSIYFHDINERVESRNLERLNAEIGNALVQDIKLQDLINHCTELLVKHLNVAFARIWTFNQEQNMLELQASAGIYTHLDGVHSREPIGQSKVGIIAEERLPHLTNDVLNDPLLNEQGWAAREGMKSFAGYPMVVEDELIGVMCVFAKHSLTDMAINAMASVSKGIANGIKRKRIAQAYFQSEEQLRQSQKIEAVGRLAGGIAHDFNNFLAVIMLHVDMLNLQLPVNSPLRYRIDEIKSVTNNAAAMVKQLLAFGRKQTLQPHPIVLNQVVKEFSEVLRPLVGEDIEIKLDLESDLGICYVDQNQIVQVLMNLAVNARDAMPNGGIIKIKTSNISFKKNDLAKPKVQPSGEYIELTVTDNGVGMDAEVQSQIFEPFFTTKEVGKGTGLGLATVYGIVKQSKGFIWAESKENEGTSFKIQLPRIDQPVTIAKPEASTAIPGGNETILLVEDEEPLRRATFEILTILGYQVFEAGNAAQAIQLTQLYKDTIHLLLTDVVMPKTNGKEVAEKIKVLHPETAVLFMSGYNDDIIAHHGILEENVNFIGKPFSPNTLAAKIREVLDNAVLD
jgi:two-component system, cell cycle sensor histidine kinase and response regulator CckA